MIATLRRTNKPDLLKAIQELEKRGYECMHPYKEIKRDQKDLFHLDDYGHAQRTLAMSDTIYLMRMRKEDAELQDIRRASYE